MNRKIKFRGLSTEGWKFGYYINAFPQTPRIVNNEQSIPVDVKTVGQFTGLKDKNGVDVYEGDILKIESEKVMVVGWSEKFASFTLNREGWMFSHWFGESCDPESCVVVGNIHENHELLKP